MNIKSILATITIITTLSATASITQAHTTSNTYDNRSVTQYTLNSRKNERLIDQLENKIKRLEDLLVLADKFIERYIVSYDRPTRSYNNNHIQQHSRNVTVYACSMPIRSNQNTLIKINTDKQSAKSDLIQQCRNKGLRQCSTKQISCDSTTVNTANHR